MEKFDFIKDIVLAVTALLGMCGWFTSGRKHRREVESIEADNKQKDMELAKTYVNEFKESIAKPLQTEMGGLKREVAKLRKAVDKVNDCEYRNNCPVRSELQKQQDADTSKD